MPLGLRTTLTIIQWLDCIPPNPSPPLLSNPNSRIALGVGELLK